MICVWKSINCAELHEFSPQLVYRHLETTANQARECVDSLQPIEADHQTIYYCWCSQGFWPELCLCLADFVDPVSAVFLLNSWNASSSRILHIITQSTLSDTQQGFSNHWSCITILNRPKGSERERDTSQMDKSDDMELSIWTPGCYHIDFWPTVCIILQLVGSTAFIQSWWCSVFTGWCLYWRSSEIGDCTFNGPHVLHKFSHICRWC